VKEERAAEIGAGEREQSIRETGKKKDGYGSRVFFFIFRLMKLDVYKLFIEFFYLLLFTNQ